MSVIRRFLERSNREKLLVALAAAILIEARIELKLIGFRHREWLERSSAPRGNDAPAKRSAGSIPAAEIAWAVKAASARIPGTTNCLVRALALKYLLNIFGHKATLRVGAAHLEGGRFEAHAWIESDDRILIGEFDNGRYAPFSSAHNPPRGNLQ